MAKVSSTARWRPFWHWLSVAGAAALVLREGLLYLGHARRQTAFALASESTFPHTEAGPWAAPMDAVYTHFDFARAAARGHPLAWLDGNGYAAAQPSLAYPLTLAVGYLAGFKSLHLFQWASVLAAASIFVLILAVARSQEDGPPWLALPVASALVAIGPLAANLFSGLEWAFGLALWSGAVVTWEAGQRERRRHRFLHATALGLWSAAAAATSPGLTGPGLVLAVTFATPGRRTGASLPDPDSRPDPSALLAAYPPLAVYLVWWFIGLPGVPLGPYRAVTDVAACLAPGAPGLAMAAALLVVAVLGLGLAPRRRYVAVLLACAISCLALSRAVPGWGTTAGTPAAVWLVLAAGLAGLSVLEIVQRRLPSRRGVIPIGMAVAAAGWLVVLAPGRIDARWRFGRNARSVFEQELRAGAALRLRFDPPPNRILLDQPGAIPYAADLPALDVSGLGGVGPLPWGDASQLGVAATLELIERLDARERPEVMALAPDRWGPLAVWFGNPLATVTSTPPGAPRTRRVIYAADWSVFEGSQQPLGLADGETVVDTLDLGDLVNERAHAVSASDTTVTMRIMANPLAPRRGLWDAGRELTPGSQIAGVLGPLPEGSRGYLLLRTAPIHRARFSVKFAGREHHMTLYPLAGWQEASIALPETTPRGQRLPMVLSALEGRVSVHHVWLAVQPRQAGAVQDTGMSEGKIDSPRSPTKDR